MSAHNWKSEAESFNNSSASGTVVDLGNLDVKSYQPKYLHGFVANLAAGVDFSAFAIGILPGGAVIQDVKLLNQATAAQGNANCTVVVANSAGTIVSKVYNTASTFPAVNTAESMGDLDNTEIPDGGDVITVAVTNDVGADPGPFLIVVEYI